MAAPGWFVNVFHKFVVDLQTRSMSGQPTDLEEGAKELWSRVTGHSEKQLAKALEEVLGGKELPISLQGGITHRVHVDRIAKYLVNRGTILDEEPDLFPAPLADAQREGEVRAYQSSRDAPPYFGAGRRPGHFNVSDAVRKAEREQQSEIETQRFLEEHGPRRSRSVSFPTDDDGVVRP